MRYALAIAGAALLAAAPSLADKPKPRSDLADLVAGQYAGDVISDARGSSRSGVGATVTKTGPNTVSVATDYSRIPGRTFRLTRAMSTIQNSGGSEVFLAEMDKSPVSLMLTIDDASWAGTRVKAGVP